MFGFLNINKPSGITSHKVISILRRITGIKQIGHAGTLDPLASGVLPVAIGKASKLIDFLNSDKTYKAGLYLGMKSDTYDICGNIEKTDTRKITLDEIKNVLGNFQGKIKQVPPAFSAVHYNGKRLYELARSGNIPDDIPSREITVYKNEITYFDYEKQILKLDISCSKGTYIRSIINDLGEELKSGAVMFELKRTVSALMEIENSIEINESLTKEDIEKNIIQPQSILNLPTVELTEKDFKLISNGCKIKNLYNIYCQKKLQDKEFEQNFISHAAGNEYLHSSVETKSEYSSELNNKILLTRNYKIVALASVNSSFIQPEKVLL